MPKKIHAKNGKLETLDENEFLYNPSKSSGRSRGQKTASPKEVYFMASPQRGRGRGGLYTAAEGLREEECVAPLPQPPPRCFARNDCFTTATVAAGVSEVELREAHNTMLLMIVYRPELVRIKTDGQEIIHIVLPKHYAQLLRKMLEEEEDEEGTRLMTRVGNFQQKNYSTEGGIDGKIGSFRRNSGCSSEEKILEISFRTVQQRRKMLRILCHGTKLDANAGNSDLNYSTEEKTTRNSIPGNKNISTHLEFCSQPFRGRDNNSEFRSKACLGGKYAVNYVC
jgi:hypothetical protein